MYRFISPTPPLLPPDLVYIYKLTIPIGKRWCIVVKEKPISFSVVVTQAKKTSPLIILISLLYNTQLLIMVEELLISQMEIQVIVDGMAAEF